MLLIPKPDTSNKIAIEEMVGLGWFASRPAGKNRLDYLHQDGEWRITTYTTQEGKTIFSGYFPTKKRLIAAVRQAGYSVSQLDMIPRKPKRRPKKRAA
jgi:hypothetical protein